MRVPQNNFGNFGGFGQSAANFGGFDPTGANLGGLGQTGANIGNPGGFGMDPMLNAMQGQLNVMMSVIEKFLMQQMTSGGGGGALPASANFGGGSGGGSGQGINNFLGGSSGGGGSSSFDAGGAAATSIDGVQAAGWGQKMAEEAKNHATGSGGYCFKYVSEVLRKFGINTSGASAYMAADQLAKSDKVKEVKVDPKDLKKLPAGAIVVWNKGAGHEHGHISISDGKGKEYSDVPRNQITNYGTSARVFIPQ